MPIAVACPHCGATGSAPDNFANRQVKCSKCKKPFTVKPPEQQPPPTPLPEVVQEEVEEVIEDVSALNEDDDEDRVQSKRDKGDKKMARRRDDDDDDDDFDDEDDKPRGKRGRRDDDDDEDEDDEDEDDKPSIKKKKKPAKKRGDNFFFDVLLFRTFIWRYVLAVGIWIFLGYFWFESIDMLIDMFKSPAPMSVKWKPILKTIGAIFLVPFVVRVGFELVAATFRLTEAVEGIRDKN